MKTVLSHANLIDCVEPKVRPDSAVLIEDGRIRAILPSGDAAAAHVRLVVWCKACGCESEPDAAEQARWYGPETPVPEWHRRLVCSKCGSRNVDMVVTGTRR